MSLLIGILSFFLILVCLLLWLLILVQLPKKEAGMGAAFGADTTAALFGAGSGNALTNLTKWMASAFVVMCVLVSWLNAHQSNRRIGGVREALSAAVPATAPAIIPGLSTTGLVTSPALATNTANVQSAPKTSAPPANPVVPPNK